MDKKSELPISGILLSSFTAWLTASFLAAGLILAASLPGCGQAGGPTASLSPEALYRLHCSSCHGDGSGNGHIAGTLKVAPRNLKHSAWQTTVTDEHIRQVIESGGGVVKLSPEMPAFADKLTPRQIQQLVGYIRRLGRY